MAHIQDSSNEEISRGALAGTPERMNPGVSRSRRQPVRVAALLLLVVCAVLLSTRIKADTGTCNGASVTLPFTDVSSSNIFFCSIASAFFTGLTNGTSATTYGPALNVSREQMAAFITRTLDQSLRRGSPRAALQRFWVLPNANGVGRSSLGGAGSSLRLLASDGADIWVANPTADTVHRVRASDRSILQTWTGASQAFGVLVLNGRVFVTGKQTPGKLYVIPMSATIDTLPVNEYASTLGGDPEGIAYDGTFIWTANVSGSVSRVPPVGSSPDVTTVQAGFVSPRGILFDGADIWVTDSGDNTLKKLNAAGDVIQTVGVGTAPLYPAFDGVNIWVPNFGEDSVTVVRAVGGLAGTVLATLSGNGLQSPISVAFDGEHILVANNAGGKVSLWKASDLTPVGSITVVGGSEQLFGACSNGINFWITRNGSSGGHLLQY